MEGHVASLPLALLIVFGTAKLFGEIFERLHQPAIVGEILAGALVGPSVLNWIQPNELLTALSELGVLFLLFRVGLEVKASELFRVGKTGLITAVLGVIFPYIAGYFLMTMTGRPSVEGMFVGAALVATSVGITAQVLAAKGVLDLESSRIILTAAVVDDVLGLIVLAIVNSAAEGQVRIAEIAFAAVAAIAFTMFVATFGRRAINRLVPKVEKSLRSAEGQFDLSLVLLFGLAVAATYVGVAAIIGAFLAGMALSEVISERVHDLTAGVSELLVPFFLAGIGLQFDFAVFQDLSLATLAVAMLGLAVVTKLVGCGLGALPAGRMNALRVGIGMIPRGEVGMVVAQLGLSRGIIEKPIYSAVVFMAVMTTVLAPPLLNWAYREAPVGEKKDTYAIG
ncbi:MAG TPA: cation:proton antiporter [Bryobacteraceae bacterium]|nr:cation:proton antiporter [Bryobacteraceae bacterium]